MSNYYKLDLAKKKIVLNHSLYNKVCKHPECPEAAEVLALLDKYPNFTFAPRTCAPSRKPKNTFEGLTVGLMKRYIKATDSESGNYEKICDMERRLSTANLAEGETKATFTQIRAWFFDEYPETIEMGTSGISYETLIIEVEQKVAAEKANIVQIPTHEVQETDEEKLAVNQ